MKRRSKLLLLAGCLLILCSLGLLAFSRLHAQTAIRVNARMVEQITAILPPRSTGVMDSYPDMEMPALQLDDRDVIALLDIPAFGVTLPVSSRWDAGDVTSCPCRFWGTVYDDSLIIGGADQPGQLDCLDRIPTGAAVTVTDMTGAEFSYVVDRIDRSDSARAQVLTNDSAQLTLFVRDAYNLNYIIVRCVSRGRIEP